MIGLFLGKKGSGKSTALRRLGHRAHLEPESRCLVWHDPSGQLEVPRALVRDTAAEVRAWCRENRTLPRLIIIRRDTADRVAQFALELRGVTLVLDELDQVCGGKRWLSQAAQEIVHYGRHLQISLLGGFRRTQNVHEDLISQADVAFIFRHSTSAPRDIDALADRFGTDYAERAKTLDPMQFLVWRDA